MEFNTFNIYLYSKSVVASDLEPKIFLTFYKSRVTEMKVYIRRVDNFHCLVLSVP